VKPRASIKQEESEAVSPALDSHADSSKPEADRVANDVEDSRWSLVCRPKVGDRVVGGGFLGVFKKMHSE